MPRPPKVKLLSPSDTRLQEPQELPALVPLFVVQGIIRGLLDHCWSPKRRPTKEGRIAQETIEQALLQLLVNGMKHSGITKETLPGLYDCISYRKGFTDHSIQEIGRKVKVAFKAPSGHTPFILVGDQGCIRESIIQCYPSKTPSASRKEWLRENLPLALQCLKKFSQCTECRGRTTMPNEAELTSMSCIKNPGPLVYAILGHFHCISPAAAKRLVCSLTKTLKSQ